MLFLQQQPIYPWAQWFFRPLLRRLYFTHDPASRGLFPLLYRLRNWGGDWGTEVQQVKGFASSFPGGVSGKEPTCQCREHNRHEFDPWVGKIPWRSGLLCPPPGDLPDPGMEPMSAGISCIAGRFFSHWATWESQVSDEWGGLIMQDKGKGGEKMWKLDSYLPWNARTKSFIWRFCSWET